MLPNKPAMIYQYSSRAGSCFIGNVSREKSVLAVACRCIKMIDYEQAKVLEVRVHSSLALDKIDA